MLISLDWISDYVDLTGLTAEAIADRLTLATAEVEGVIERQRFVQGVLVGKVIACERLDEKRTFCTVDCGGKTYTTVCGAGNVRIGLIAPFAPVGTRLTGGITLEKSIVAGKTSEGVLCSASELGMSHWHEAVFECPADTLIGQPFLEWVPEKDILIEIDNKSLTHRPDLWGHYGFAREFAAIFDRELKPLPVHDLSRYAALPAYPVAIDDPENCPCYGCIEFEAQLLAPSPLFMQRRLHALGQRTYNMGVDVTNYVNWEIAQPTHAFDAELIGSIRIGPMRETGLFRTLDGQERKMLPDDMMIWGTVDGRLKPVAVAGIMGGLETEVSPQTKKLLLESANFKAARIRKTVTRLDLRTDASQRYEKSQPPSNVRVGIERILKLFETAGIPFKVLSRFSVDGDLHETIRPITLGPGQLPRLAGIDLPVERVLGILHALGFQAEYAPDGSLQVGVPPYRSARDISIPEDIVEEVLRVYGFDNIPAVMPLMPLQPLFVEKSIKREHKIRRLLGGGHGFFEVHNYCWMSDHWLTTLGFEPGETLVLRNPVTPWETRLRTTLIPNLLALVPKNRLHRDRFDLFEFGQVFFPNPALKDEPRDEYTRLAGVSFRPTGTPPQDHYLEIKSALEDIGRVLDRPFHFVVGAESPTPWQSEGSWVEIRQRQVGKNRDDIRIGGLGVLDTETARKVSPEGGRIVWFELEMDKIDGALFPTVQFVEPAKFPGSWLDFSLIWSIDLGFDRLEKLLDGFSDPLLKRREFLTAYRGKGLEKGTASYSFRFLIGAEDHTLSGEEIEAFHRKYMAFLQQNGIALR